MKATKEEQIRVTIEMDGTEAHLLMALVQNPITENESDAIRELRKSLFTALQQQGIRP